MAIDGTALFSFSNLPIGEDPSQRAGDGGGDEEVADPQGVFSLCVEEGEVDGLVVVVRLSASPHRIYS